MNLTVSRAWIFPLAVFGFAAVGIRYADWVFTPATRWLPLLLLALFLLWRGRLFLAFRTPLGPAIGAWIGWVLLTALWSDAPLLSLMKGAALALAVVPLVSGGVYWAQQARPADPLSYLAPLWVLVFFASLFGLGVFRTMNGGIPIFEGLSENANAFGALIAISLPYPLHAAYRGTNWPRTAAWIGVATLLLALLMLTRSRSAALIALCVLLSFGFVALPRKLLVAGALAGLTIVGAAVAFPSITGPARVLVQKGHDEDLLFSRRALWSRSYDYAAQGGIVGLGFGVSAESKLNFEGGSNSIGYVREKGSSPLAIVEETGLTGLAIVALLLAQLFTLLIIRTRAIAARDVRLAAGLATGALAGVVLQSLLEGWWTAPGALLSIFFWSTAGVALGIVRRPRSEPLQPEPQ